MKNGFIRVAAATPKTLVSNCVYNATEIFKNIRTASDYGAALIAFPELSITGYTCGDLFFQNVLLASAEKEILSLCSKSKDIDIISIVGAPIRINSGLYNCAIIIYKGTILAIIPKQNIPNHGEFYESRYFSGEKLNTTINYCKQTVPILSNAIFKCKNINNFTFGVEVCEDLWVSNSPSISLAENGANIIVNISASNEIAGRSEYRENLVKIQSSKLICGYIFSNCGFGESTTDLVFAGHNLIVENGKVLKEAKPFTCGIIYSDIDLELLESERCKHTTYNTKKNDDCTPIYFEFYDKKLKLIREYSKTPFVPLTSSGIYNRCTEILSIQTAALATRLSNAKISNVVLGLSGGLDSTLALIVTVRAFDMLKIDRKNILAVTMPCFGTTERTKNNAKFLANAYGVSFKTINISKSVTQHFIDIEHDPNNQDVTYENSQARERTQVLMDLANKCCGLVIGTGDLSELALGWTTYNGDHMSMYSVNASVPKTLIKHLVAYEASSANESLKKVLIDVYNTPVSPELLPPKNNKISQKTEDIIGPYELHDFFLYYMLRYGFSPSKILKIALCAFKDTYNEDTIIKWLSIFIKRFFSQQFKRSCLPDGPKVGTVAVSPRGDLRMPSDASFDIWIEELKFFE